MNEYTSEIMTMEEMIDTLKGLVFNSFDRTTVKERQALDMAIKILRQDLVKENTDLVKEDDENADKKGISVETVSQSLVKDGDLISRTDLLNAIWQKEYGKDYDGVNMLNIPHIDIIENMPSAEKTAEWIIKHKVTNSGSFWEIKCSNCEIESDSIYRYCPYCGAKMKESGE